VLWSWVIVLKELKNSSSQYLVLLSHDRLGVHRGAPWLVDDTTIHVLNDQEAKKKPIRSWRKIQISEISG